MIFGSFIHRRRVARLNSFSVLIKSVVRLYYSDYNSAGSSIQLSAYYNVRNCFPAKKGCRKKYDSTGENTGDDPKQYGMVFSRFAHRLKQVRKNRPVI